MKIVKQKLNGGEQAFPLLILGTESRDGIVILLLSLLCVLTTLDSGAKVLWAAVPSTVSPPLSHLIKSLGHLTPKFAFEPKASSSL